MKRITELLWLFVLVLVFAPGMQAQVATSRQVPFNKVASTLAGCTPAPCTQPASVDVQVWDDATSTLPANLILTEQHRGASPGSAVVDNDGNLTFLLGSQLAAGLPPDQFTSGSSRFLDVVDPTTGASVLTGSRVPLNAVAFSLNPGPKGDQGIQGPPGQQGAQGPPGVVQTVNAGDTSIMVTGTAADRFVAIAGNGVTDAHVANGALSPAKITGTAATLGPNNFVGNQSISGNLGLPDSTATAGNLTKGGILFLHNFGSLNTFLGQNAGNLTMTGGQNTASGVEAFQSNTTGNKNTASGYNALRSNTTGSRNTGSGWIALQRNTTGSSNAAVGDSALYRNTTGGNNTAVGVQAGVTEDLLNANTTGSNNTFLGYNSGPGTPTQLSNATAIGANALVSASDSLVLGDNNVKVGIGTSAPTQPLEVVGNVRATSFIGSGASLTGVSGLGSANTFTAQNLFTATPTGSAVGQGPLFVNPASAGAGETLLGVGVGGSEKLRLTSDGSLNLSGSLNSSAGNLTLGDSTPTAGNILKGGFPFIHNFGVNNTFIGKSAGNLAMSGTANTAAGASALNSNTTGFSNTASGVGALGQNTTGDSSTASGAGALQHNTTGRQNTASGNLALANNSQGSQNSASGVEALPFNTTGGSNTASGYQALYANTTGNFNTAGGASALLSNTTGSNNTTIGAGADVSVGNLTNATAIGAGAIVNASNKIRLGNSAVTVVETSGAVIANGGVSGSTTPFGTAVSGSSSNGTGVAGSSTGGTGVVGETSSTADNAYGVRGTARAASGLPVGIFGEAPNSPNGTGVSGSSINGTGVFGFGRVAGVWGRSTGTSGIGALGEGTTGVEGRGETGVAGFATSGANTVGVSGRSFDGTGVQGDGRIGVHGFGEGTRGIGVYGEGTTAVYANSTIANGIGVDGWISGANGIGVRGTDGGANGNGVAGISVNGNGVYGLSNPPGHAGYFVGKVLVDLLGAEGTTSLCWNGSKEIAFCSSSLRYKTDVRPFLGGLDIVHRLRPIAFTWKQGGTRDIGLGAEEVDKVEPLLTFRNEKGEIEGVKYNQLSAVFVNAIREQQAQIRKQQQQMAALQAQLAANGGRLRKTVGALKAENVDLRARLQKIERSMAFYVLPKGK